MTVAADRQFTLQFDGALTMTHHATNLDLPGEANITTAAGDVAVFQSTGANTVQCISYVKADGTPVVSAGIGTIPVFKVTKSGNQTISTGTYTKVATYNESFDTNSDFASDRFTPSVAGKYELTCRVNIESLADGSILDLALYKNGATFHSNTEVVGAAANAATTLTAIVDADGSSDYYEMYVRHDHGDDRTLSGGVRYNVFSGFKIAE
jgi:hypothetical protein